MHRLCQLTLGFVSDLWLGETLVSQKRFHLDQRMG